MTSRIRGFHRCRSSSAAARRGRQLPPADLRARGDGLPAKLADGMVERRRRSLPFGVASASR